MLAKPTHKLEQPARETNKLQSKPRGRQLLKLCLAAVLAAVHFTIPTPSRRPSTWSNRTRLLLQPDRRARANTLRMQTKASSAFMGW